MIIRNSEITDFLRCRLRWEYRWVKQQEPKKKSSKLVMGTLFHKFLETYYEMNTPAECKPDVAIEAMKSMYDEQVAAKIDQGLYDPVESADMWALLEGMANYYHTYWSSRQTKRWEVLATEQTYYINMDTLECTTERTPKMEQSDTIWYECTLDLVVKVNDQVWVVDHKTVSSLEHFASKIEMDRQISRYIFAAHVIFPNWNVQGLIYNLIKKELPHEPTVLKKGGLSKAKDQRTTYNMYYNKLIELGIAKDPKDVQVNPETWKVIGGWAIDPEHAEILQLLAQRESVYGNDWMQRIPVKRNDAELNNAMNELMQVAKTIQGIRKWMVKHPNVKDWRNPIYRNITSDCSWDCGYKALCIAGMDGSDVTYLEDELLEPIQENYEIERVE